MSERWTRRIQFTLILIFLLSELFRSIIPLQMHRNILYIVPSTLLYGVCSYVCIKATLNSEREYFKFFGYFIILSAVGDIVWQIIYAFEGSVPMLSAADLFYLPAYIMLIIGISRMYGTFNIVTLDKELIYDTVIFSFIILYILIVSMSYEGLQVSIVLSFIYLLLDILCSFSIVMLLTKFTRGNEDRKIAQLLLLGLLAYMTADIIYIACENEIGQITVFADFLYDLTAVLVGFGASLSPELPRVDIFKYLKKSIESIKSEMLFTWIYALVLFIYIPFLFIRTRILSTATYGQLFFYGIPLFFVLYRFYKNLNLLTNHFIKDDRQNTFDALTGFYKREMLPLIIDGIKKIGTKAYPVSVILLDIKGMQFYNQLYGEAAGDNIIRKLSNMIYESSNGDGIYIRYGGDDFLCILSNTGNSSCLDVEKRIYQLIGEYNLSYDDKVAVTCVCETIFEGEIEKRIPAMELRLYEKKLFEKKEFKKLLESNRKLTEQQQIEVLKSFLKIVELKDAYTENHSTRVAEYAKIIAVEMGLKEDEVLRIYNAGMLHDIGKILIPEEILNKPGKLTEKEMDIMKRHPDMGAEIVSSISILKSIAPYIRYHHERFDGSKTSTGGYPGELSSDDIPLGARIISVADSFDAMVSDRPYRKAMPFEKALKILEKEKGRQFDPNIVDIFLNIINKYDLKNIEL